MEVPRNSSCSETWKIGECTQKTSRKEGPVERRRGHRCAGGEADEQSQRLRFIGETERALRTELSDQWEWSQAQDMGTPTPEVTS